MHTCQQWTLACLLLHSDRQLAGTLWWIIILTVPNEFCGLSWGTVSWLKLPLYQHSLRETYCNNSDTFWPCSAYQREREDNHPLIKKKIKPFWLRQKLWQLCCTSKHQKYDCLLYFIIRIWTYCSTLMQLYLEADKVEPPPLTCERSIIVMTKKW